jgi:hypothetical protein
MEHANKYKKKAPSWLGRTSKPKSSIWLLGSVCEKMIFTGLLFWYHGGLIHGFHFPDAIKIVLQTMFS